MDATILSSVAGALLALLYAYVPGFSSWFQQLGRRPDGSYDDGTLKRLLTLAFLLLVSAAAFGLACSGWGMYFGLELSCDRRGIAELTRAFIFTVMANQATYRLARKANFYPRRDDDDALPEVQSMTPEQGEKLSGWEMMAKSLRDRTRRHETKDGSAPGP